MVAASVAEAAFPLARRAQRPDEVDLAEVRPQGLAEVEPCAPTATSRIHTAAAYPRSE